MLAIAPNAILSRLSAYRDLSAHLASAADRAVRLQRPALDPYESSKAVIELFISCLKTSRVNFPGATEQLHNQLDILFQNHLFRNYFPFCRARGLGQSCTGCFLYNGGRCAHRLNPGYAQKSTEEIIESLLGALVSLEQAQMGGVDLPTSRARSAFQATQSHPLWGVNTGIIPTGHDFPTRVINSIVSRSLLTALQGTPDLTFGMPTRSLILRLYSCAYLCYAKLLYKAIEDPLGREDIVFRGGFTCYCSSMREEGCVNCPIAVTAYSEEEGTYFTCSEFLRAVDSDPTRIGKARNMRSFLLLLENMIKRYDGK